MKAYDTLSQALEDLKDQGYTYDFNLEEKQLGCEKLNKNFAPKDFKVVGSYRFEGMSNPDDNSVIYVIETASGEKGTLVDAYGTYADSLSLEMAQRLRMDRHPDHIG
ncbi:phosphoribosylpyrophosphate synthetase [Flavilitoribacter nigricans]|uniref:Phosphoribosylpyrophosphate synthetase n=1 Tax=Flavilitoribacter nigricans (strain ATCC 23147 / DSM 23189 / NBRC 102662 / NCIMB 1420 / SS-2) TaxID=1122177 RepID=A0A2D0N3H2_FLAN2|nr:phosphoribosylpyrophosphate synthetase [Flavilitoribacter nigricans]PHN03055.1 phosphoribosylpyrophosphate synthetase [Flavilitoribacter nigricans DSM 23189 = NBRC 102662]